MKTQYYISKSKKFSYARNKKLRLRKRLRDGSIREAVINSEIDEVINHLKKTENFIQTDYPTFLTIGANVQ